MNPKGTEQVDSKTENSEAGEEQSEANRVEKEGKAKCGNEPKVDDRFLQALRLLELQKGQLISRGAAIAEQSSARSFTTRLSEQRLFATSTFNSTRKSESS